MLILQHFNLDLLITVKVNVSNYVIAKVLSLIGLNSTFYSIAYYFKRINFTKISIKSIIKNYLLLFIILNNKDLN
jgi:hypothetical protein